MRIAICLLTFVVSAAAAQEINNPNQLVPCPQDQNTQYNNCWGTFNSPKGDKLVGEFKAGKLHGQGSITFANSNRYAGEFVEGKFQGKGTFTFSQGHGYVGEWRDNKPHGRGKETYADGRQPNEGVFENGKFIRAEQAGVSSQPVAQSEDGAKSKFKETISEALAGKTDLVTAISVNAEYKKGFAYEACYASKNNPAKSDGLVISGYTGSPAFKEWWGSLTSQQINTFTNYPRLKKFATSKELYDYVSAQNESRRNGVPCMVIIDFPENMKFYLESFEGQNRSIKYGPSLPKDQALRITAEAERFKTVDDLLIASEFGTGIRATEFYQFKELKIATVADFNKAAKRMKDTKYNAEDNPSPYAVFDFVADEDYAKKNKTTAVAVKLAREKREAAERKARMKAEQEAFVKAKYKTVFYCQHPSLDISKTLAYNLMREFVSGSRAYAYMMTSSSYSKFCSMKEVNFVNYELWKKITRTTVDSGGSGGKGYLVEMDGAVYGVISSTGMR